MGGHCGCFLSSERIRVSCRHFKFSGRSRRKQNSSGSVKRSRCTPASRGRGPGFESSIDGPAPLFSPVSGRRHLPVGPESNAETFRIARPFR